VSPSIRSHPSCLLFARHDTETVIHSDSDFATVAFLRIRHASLDSKPEHVVELAVPALLDLPYRQAAEYLQAKLSNNEQTTERTSCSSRALSLQLVGPTSRSFGSWISVGNVHRDLHGASDVSLEDEVRECFHILQSKSVSCASRWSVS
jgi:diphthine-ammonia ligase